MKSRDDQATLAFRNGAGVKMPSFGWGLRIALILPIMTAVAGWLLQWSVRFPHGSPGASFTASMVFLPPLAEIIPVPIAIAKLVRHAALRSSATIALTTLGLMFLLLGSLFAIALFAD